MTRAAHRWESCTLCRHVMSATDMTPVSEVVLGRKRGLVCPRCKDRRRKLSAGGERGNHAR